MDIGRQTAKKIQYITKSVSYRKPTYVLDISYNIQNSFIKITVGNVIAECKQNPVALQGTSIYIPLYHTITFLFIYYINHCIDFTFVNINYEINSEFSVLTGIPAIISVV